MVIIVSSNCVYYNEMLKTNEYEICLSGLFIFIFTYYPWTSEIDVKQGPLMCTPGPLRLLCKQEILNKLYYDVKKKRKKKKKVV